jgi:SAM-dependent methyltransferase
LDFEQLIEDAARTPFEGWDFGVLDGRYVEGKPSWDLRALIRARMSSAESMLDLGTGGGEFLSSLAPLPALTAATEGWAPNVEVARRTLRPLGVEVADTTAEPRHLPFDDGTFDLVLSRHEEYTPEELRRVLRPGGTFLTQQVGGRDLEELNAVLGAPPHEFHYFDLAYATAELERGGFEILDGREELIPGSLHDIGAVVLLLRITPWHVPGFSVEAYDRPLRELHARLSAGTPLAVQTHRFVITARPA